MGDMMVSEYRDKLGSPPVMGVTTEWRLGNSKGLLGGGDMLDGASGGEYTDEELELPE